jgi:Uma2 family endonuclease
MDPLSDVLRAVRLDGACFYRVEAAGDWRVEAAAAARISPRVLPDSEHLIPYHVLTGGGCWAGIPGEEMVELNAGDVVVFPQGNPHIMASSPVPRAEAALYAATPETAIPRLLSEIDLRCVALIPPAGADAPMLAHALLPTSAERGNTMSMPAMRPVTTIEELWALPEDGQRHELLDGVHVVTPSPAYRHQSLHGTLFKALVMGVRGRRDLEVLSSPADIRLGPRTLVQPDLFVLRIDPAAPPQDWSEVGPPLLAIEILSPSTAARDRGAKRRIYQQAGVPEYWVVDPDARLIERWRPEDARPEIVDEVLTWTVDGEEVLRVGVAAVFGD